MCLSLGGIIGTGIYAGAHSGMPTQMGGTPPSMNGQTPPSMPGQSQDSQTSDTNTQSGDTNQSSDTNTQTNDSTNTQSGDTTIQQSQPSGMPSDMKKSGSLSTAQIAIIVVCALGFTVSGLLLIATKGCTLTFAEAFASTKKIAISAMIAAVVTSALSFGAVTITNALSGNKGGTPPQMQQGNMPSQGQTPPDGMPGNQQDQNQNSNNSQSNNTNDSSGT